MGKTTFSGPLRVGKNTGVSSTSTIGTTVIEQSVTVAATTSGASTIVVPQDARITQISLLVRTAATDNSGGINVRVGNSSDVDYFATVKGSASNIYMCGVAPNVAAASAASWYNMSADTQVYVDVTAAATAAETAGFVGILSVQYIVRSV